MMVLKINIFTKITLANICRLSWHHHFTLSRPLESLCPRARIVHASNPSALKSRFPDGGGGVFKPTPRGFNSFLSSNITVVNTLLFCIILSIFDIVAS